MKKITILGATGSIGVNTLDVLSRQSDWQVYALTAFGQVDKLAAQCLAHQPAYAWVGSAEKAAELQQLLRSKGSATEVLHSQADQRNQRDDHRRLTEDIEQKRKNSVHDSLLIIFSIFLLFFVMNFR